MQSSFGLLVVRVDPPTSVSTKATTTKMPSAPSETVAFDRISDGVESHRCRAVVGASHVDGSWSGHAS
jgi:hypothetical protein